jgi:transcriptional regulator with XRE-family HTH domain
MSESSPIYKAIGERIRELRSTFKGHGISQEELAKSVQTTTNTVSRWETAKYKPSIQDLEKVARFFGVPITVFFPDLTPTPPVQALLSATGDLSTEDLEEVTRYALFRKARHAMNPKRKRKRGD